MRIRWIVIIPIVLTAVLVFVLFVPIVPSANFTVCNRSACTNVVQYDSISYGYAGWGGYFQSGVFDYTVQGWMCFCGAGALRCCVAPLAWIIWPIVYFLSAVDIVSLAFAIRRFPVNTA